MEQHFYLVLILISTFTELQFHGGLTLASPHQAAPSFHLLNKVGGNQMEI